MLLRQAWLGTSRNLPNPDDASYVAVESHSALASFFYSLNVPVIDRPRFTTYQLEPLQTSLECGAAIAGCGFRTQNTLLTARLDAALQFLREKGGRALMGCLTNTTALRSVQPPNAEHDLQRALDQ